MYYFNKTSPNSTAFFKIFNEAANDKGTIGCEASVTYEVWQKEL